MAGASTPELAAAVSNKGGLGALGLGASDWDSAARQVNAFRALSDGPLHLNFFCHDMPQYDESLEKAWIALFKSEFELLNEPAPDSLTNPYISAKNDHRLVAFAKAHRPDVISFHFGLPNSEILSALQQLDIPIITSITNLSDAERALSAGIDGLVAQGIEAGGHRGTFDSNAHDTLTTHELIARLRPMTLLPIVAAGGIMDGAGIANAMNSGADAVQLGSAFLLCPESSANDDYRNQIRKSSGTDTVVTRAISGRAARGIRNTVTAVGDATPPSKIPPYPITYDLSKQLNTLATKRGGSGYGAYWAGTGIDKARELSAGDLVEKLIEEMATASHRPSRMA